MRNAEYLFTSIDAGEIVNELVARYEEITGNTAQPGSPDRVFLQWVADAIVQERAYMNMIGNQNLPSRAEGANLDALGELFYNAVRPAATPSGCTVRFHISAAQSRAVLIPSGTRVTDSSQTLYWRTEEDAFIAAGSTYADLHVVCMTNGEIGNGFTAGQINTIVDLYDYYSACENTTETAGGADEATDEEFYELMRLSLDGYSSAGPRNAYIYYAKRASTEIKDVIALSPSPCVVKLYATTEDGAAPSEIKSLILAACSADEVRPLADSVSVDDPSEVNYNITLTYYIQTGSQKSATEIADAVNAAVAEYKEWQDGKIGKDINPSHLVGLLMQTGIKRVVLTAPSYTQLIDGKSGGTPQYAKAGTVTVTSGGYEDE